MTTERTDHVAEAKRLMAEIEGMDPATQWMVMTQKSLLVTSHIGLAAVEQQRIANIVALSDWQDVALGDGQIRVPSFTPEGILRDDIREGLGL